VRDGERAQRRVVAEMETAAVALAVFGGACAVGALVAGEILDVVIGLVFAGGYAALFHVIFRGTMESQIAALQPSPDGAVEPVATTRVRTLAMVGVVMAFAGGFLLLIEWGDPNPNLGTAITIPLGTGVAQVLTARRWRRWEVAYGAELRRTPGIHRWRKAMGWGVNRTWTWAPASG
jgi:hypothetical protein